MELEGKTVLVIHPAWHSCGSHAVFRSQIEAYRTMGARVWTLAVRIAYERPGRAEQFWRKYAGLTEDLSADARFHTGMSNGFLLGGRFGRRARLRDASYARQMAGIAELSPLPQALLRNPIHLVHCNYYFNMPLALRLKTRHGAPILIDTHDIQSYQYDLRRQRSFDRRRTCSVEEMLDDELAYTRQADVILHLNAEEHAFFAERIPDRPHVLRYPGMRLEPGRDERPYFLIVASANHPNYLSIAWFLKQVLPLAADIHLRIAGNIDRAFRRRDPALHARHRTAFRGRVENLQALYEHAAAALLPTVAGHGVSIKTIEAMGMGVPLIATPMAFRGLRIDLAELCNLRLAETAADFARHIREVNALAKEEARRRDSRRGGSATREAFEELFSFEAYVQGLKKIVDGLLVPSGAPQKETG